MPEGHSNATLNLSSGFKIIQGGSLEIVNSVINVAISPDNPFLFYLAGGDLVLKNDTVNVTSVNITPNPSSVSGFMVTKVDRGNLDIQKNTFRVDAPFSVGFLMANSAYNTNGFNIVNNVFRQFHGGIYLVNSSNAVVDDNTFDRVSLSSVFSSGTDSEIARNIFSFPGNLSTGDAIDVIGASNLVINDNIIGSGANYGIFIAGADHLQLNKNNITDGLSYGIYIQSVVSGLDKKHRYLQPVLKGIKNTVNSHDITVTENYLAQNRYGLAANAVNNLVVKKNIFIQKFSDNATRQFWTDNAHLITASSNISWSDNLYKEAFTQEVPGDNYLAKQFVSFPVTGGVIWP